MRRVVRFNSMQCGCFPAMTIQKGVYQHYKGGLYQVLEVARHSETEELLVVYRTLYGDYSMWVRPLDMFRQSVEVEGEIVPRFRLVESSEPC